MKFVGARLGEDFDPAIAQFVVFRGKRILIDPDLANGRLGRKLAGGKAVNVHLPAVRPRRRPGESFEIGLQLIRIVGQGFEFFARKHDGACIVGGIHVDRGRGVGDLDLLLLHRDGQLDVQSQRLVSYGGVVVLVNGESLRDDVQRVFSRRQPLNSYMPCEFVWVVTGEPAGGVMTTVALVMAAPEGSVTCPRRTPGADWAGEKVGKAVIKRA